MKPTLSDHTRQKTIVCATSNGEQFAARSATKAGNIYKSLAVLLGDRQTTQGDRLSYTV